MKWLFGLKPHILILDILFLPCAYIHRVTLPNPSSSPHLFTGPQFFSFLEFFPSFYWSSPFPHLPTPSPPLKHTASAQVRSNLDPDRVLRAMDIPPSHPIRCCHPVPTLLLPEVG